MKVKRIRLGNFRPFRNAELSDIPDLCILVGENGTGKTSLFDVFNLLRDTLKENVKEALVKRGGFQETRSRDREGPIEIQIAFEEKTGQPLFTYSLEIDAPSGTAVVAREKLDYGPDEKGIIQRLLDFRMGKGFVVTNGQAVISHGARPEREKQALASRAILAVKGLAQFQRFPVMMRIGQLIENWHVSDFNIDSARRIQEDGYAEHLSRNGENLALATRFLYDNHKPLFNEILEKLSSRIPGVGRVEAKVTEEGRVLLRFQDQAFKDPFLARHVSDGTIRMFAYLVLLHDPSPHPLLCVEEPENHFYPMLQEELIEEFRLYAARGGQVFVSTHSPDFLNGAKLEEVYRLAKQGGYATVMRVADDPQVAAYMRDGEKMGYLWKQGFLDGISMG